MNWTTTMRERERERERERYAVAVASERCSRFGIRAKATNFQHQQQSVHHQSARTFTVVSHLHSFSSCARLQMKLLGADAEECAERAHLPYVIYLSLPIGGHCWAVSSLSFTVTELGPLRTQANTILGTNTHTQRHSAPPLSLEFHLLWALLCPLLCFTVIILHLE